MSKPLTAASNRVEAPCQMPSVTSSVHPRWRARATTALARDGGTDRPPKPSTTRSIPSISTAATSTGSAPGSGITAIRLRSAPISTAASRPTSGWPMIATWPPSAVTAATIFNSSDRAPDTTATVPRGSTPRSDTSSKLLSGCATVSGAAATGADRRPAPTFPDTDAICRRSCSSCSARVTGHRFTAFTPVTTAPCTSSASLGVRMFVRCRQ